MYIIAVDRLQLCTYYLLCAYQYFVLYCDFPQKPELSGMFDVIDDLDFYLYPLENDLMTLAMDSAFSVSPSH